MSGHLHVLLAGQGRPVVLLHGWGMHAGVFQAVSDHLAQHHSVAAVDLPGHGESDVFEQFADLTQLAAYIVENMLPLFQTGVVLIGWSLGGLLAQAIAIRYPQYVTKLVLICSTPSFRQHADWQCAVEDKVLTAFAADLQRDYQGTLARFLALQFFGAPRQKESLRQARTLLFSRPQAQPGTLTQGLHLLQHSDLRTKLSEIRCPTLVINGEHDTLVPAAAGAYLAEHVSAGRCVIVKGAGHAPFLSHVETVTYFLDRFIYEY